MSHLAQHQGCLSDIVPSPQQAEGGKTLGGDTGKTTWLLSVDIPYHVASA